MEINKKEIKFSTFEDLEKYLFLMLLQEQSKNGLPITFTFSEEQTYVHLLIDGNLITDPNSKIPNHFNYFPVGTECLSLIPIDYHFSKFDLIKSNRKI